MRVSFIMLIFCLTDRMTQADLLADIRSCKVENDLLKQLTCFDAIVVSGSENVAPGLAASGTTSGVTKATVELITAKIRVQRKNFERRIFSDRVELLPSFKNTSKKTVVAIAHTLSVTDAFGDKIVDGDSKLDIKIPPGKTVESETFYMWENNEFFRLSLTTS